MHARSVQLDRVNLSNPGCVLNDVNVSVTVEPDAGAMMPYIFSELA